MLFLFLAADGISDGLWSMLVKPVDQTLVNPVTVAEDENCSILRVLKLGLGSLGRAGRGSLGWGQHRGKGINCHMKIPLFH